MDILYEDNHLLIVNKHCGEIVQGDKTGDRPLSEMAKDYIKQKYAKPGNVFLGVVHRLDRPVSGIVVFARTSKALTRLNAMFRNGEVSKTYWAIVQGAHSFKQEVTLHHWITRDSQKNISRAYDRQVADSKEAKLRYQVLRTGERYSLLQVRLLTGRHHQIRCQLAKMGLHIKGDLKYGASRSNKDGGISLLARHITFQHPVSKQEISITAPLPKDGLWEQFVD